MAQKGISSAPISSSAIGGDADLTLLPVAAPPNSGVGIASGAISSSAVSGASANLVAASISLAATEAADTASVSVNLSSGVALAATEAQDAASGSVDLSSSLTLAATENADTASGAVTSQTSAALAATEAQDTASVSLALSSALALAGTEASDTASVALTLSDTVALAATESPDTVALVVDAAQSFIDLDLAATEAPDTMAATVTALTNATLDLAATEAPDTVRLSVQYGDQIPDTHDGVGGPIHRVKDRWKWRSRQEDVREALTRVTDDEEAVEAAYEAIEAVVRNEPRASDLLADFARRDQELYDQTLAIMAGVLSIKVAEQRQIAIQLAEAARRAAEEDDLEVLLLAA